MEEDKEVLLPRGEEYIFGEEAILGDINYINEILKEKLSIEEYNKVITRISIIKADLREKQQLEKENKIYKEELKKIDKALNLEEGTAAPYRSDIIESLKKGIESLKEIIDNSVPKSKVKERMEVHKKYKQSYLKEYEKDLKENRDTTIYHDFAVKEQAKIDMCEELLEEEGRS